MPPRSKTNPILHIAILRGEKMGVGLCGRIVPIEFIADYVDSDGHFCLKCLAVYDKYRPIIRHEEYE